MVLLSHGMSTRSVHGGSSAGVRGQRSRQHSAAHSASPCQVQQSWQRSRSGLLPGSAAPRAPYLWPRTLHKSTCRAKGDEEEADWEKEMSIFAKRLSAPNQLATLRELESKVNVGKVLFVKDSLAIVSGLNADAPLGTKLSFVTGGTGVLLWHRSDNIAFVLILGGASAINVGTGLECKIKGVLQVIDEVKGPVTKKEFELFEVPSGDSLFGRVVNFLGQPLPGLSSSSTTTAPASSSAAPAAAGPAAISGAAGGGASPTPQRQGSEGGSSSSAGPKKKSPGGGADKLRPLLNSQVQMKNREQINEAMLTGVRALDLLTPMGRGASLLVIGPHGSGKSSLAEDSVLGQKDSGVHCVFASTTRSLEDLRGMEQRLAAAGVLGTTCVVASDPSAPLGEKYATMCAAYTIGEAVRDRGGHCLVVVDDMASLCQVWDTLAITGLSGLGKDVAREGLIKDSSGRDLSLPAPESEEELVDYEGMLVSGAVAQRRAFFSTLFMRTAKMSRALGGGSLSALLLVPGRPATGVTRKVDMSKYQTLSEDQKAKIKAALEKKAAEDLAALAPLPGELTTEAVEEFISIADGQLVLDPVGSSGAGGADAPRYRANPKLSITRVGARAFPRALEVLAPQIRLSLAQAEDARKFKLDSAADPLAQKADAMNLRMAAALTQAPGQPTSLEELVVLVLAVQRGFADSVPPAQVPDYIRRALKFVQLAAPQALHQIRSSRMLTATSEKAITDALSDLARMPATTSDATVYTSSSSSSQTSA